MKVASAFYHPKNGHFGKPLYVLDWYIKDYWGLQHSDILNYVLPSPLSSFIEIYLTSKNCIYLKCTTWCFDICIHCELIPIIKLINISITSQLPFFFVIRILKIYFLSKFQVYNTVLLLAIVTMLYIRSPEFTHLITGSL